MHYYMLHMKLIGLNPLLGIKVHQTLLTYYDNINTKYLAQNQIMYQSIKHIDTLTNKTIIKIKIY